MIKEFINKYNNLIIYLLIISSIVGIGISYASVYIFQIFLLIALAFLLLNNNFKTLLNYGLKTKSLIILISIIWFLIYIFISTNTQLAINHLVRISIGFLFTYIVTYSIKNINQIQKVITIIAGFIIVNILIGLTESFGIFRWFISRLSPVVEVFGYKNELDTIIKQSISTEYVYTMPTGFQFNPNDFALLLSMSLPFFILMGRTIISLPVIFLILWLTIASGAKIIFLTCILITLISFVFINKRKIIRPIFSLSVILFFITNGFGLLKGQNIKINETQAFCYKLVGLTPPSYNLQILESENSGSVRRELISFGISKSKENYLMGYGGGQSQYEMEKVGGIGKEKITSLHNFWIEILMEGGIIYLLIYMLWYLYLLWQLFKVYKTSLNKNLRLISASLLIVMTVFVFSSIAPSSVHYFLPMYLMFGLTLSTINIHKTYENSPII